MIEASTTAHIVIDLQHGIVANTVGPHSSAEVIARNQQIADKMRELGGMVVLVRVAFSEDGKDMLRPDTDTAAASFERPANWADIVPEMGPRKGDLLITKHQWGAFYGTALDLQLRRRGIKTIVIGGISTNFGVESTARDAYERGYNLVFVEDAMAGMSAEAHEFPVKNIFPRIGKLRSTAQVLGELK